MCHRSTVIVGIVRSRLSLFFSNVHHMIPETNFLEYLKKVLPPDDFEAYLVAAFRIKLHFVKERIMVCY